VAKKRDSKANLAPRNRLREGVFLRQPGGPGSAVNFPSGVRARPRPILVLMHFESQFCGCGEGKLLKICLLSCCSCEYQN
jgi:hypothetical protein